MFFFPRSVPHWWKASALPLRQPCFPTANKRIINSTLQTSNKGNMKEQVNRHNNNNNNYNNNNNNTLFKYIYAHKQDTQCVFEKADHEVIPIKGPLTKL